MYANVLMPAEVNLIPWSCDTCGIIYCYLTLSVCGSTFPILIHISEHFS